MSIQDGDNVRYNAAVLLCEAMEYDRDAAKGAHGIG
jgi:hypothetical protein